MAHPLKVNRLFKYPAKVVLASLSLVFAPCLLGYTSLDPSDPISLGSSSFTYGGRELQLGPLAFFVDGQLSEEEASRNPFVFRSLNEAVKQLTQGTEEKPMTLFLAPYVYWIDDPDDPAIRKGKNGSPPFALEIECEWLRFEGLTKDPRKVVIAANRGQTIGARGNFTLLRISGEGTSSENLTFGNYCNVDLVYPLKPELSRKKRASAIVQAQLILCDGDKVVARNTHFISRLNLCPFVGAKRILFDRCHFESSDDALCGSGVYLSCSLDFYSSKPFYWTTGTGAVFLDCDIRSFTKGKQYFTKANGQLTVIDTRFESDTVEYIGWNDVVPPTTRNYQHNLSLNGSSYIVGTADRDSTVLLDSLLLRDAYAFADDAGPSYNLYNLLKGDDGWDPCSLKQRTLQAEKSLERQLTDIPVRLKLVGDAAEIESGKQRLNLRAEAYRFGNYVSSLPDVSWHLRDKDAEFVELSPSEGGSKCVVTGTNQQDRPRDVLIVASTESGLEAAYIVHVLPEQLAPPELVRSPKLSDPVEGTVELHYELDTEFLDQSQVDWYRCSSPSGADPIKVAVSRPGAPLKNYSLTAGDRGYYIMAKLSPKHVRSEQGPSTTLVSEQPVSFSDVSGDTRRLSTNFHSLSVGNQEQVKPGFWTFRPFLVHEEGRAPSIDEDHDAWYYGEGSQGSADLTGLLQAGRSATLLYTPTFDQEGKMSVSMEVAPYKTAGQGFSVAPLYMDVLIKLDTKTMSGYGLRFQRTTKYGNAVDCYLVRYQNGIVEQIGESVSTSCFRTPCFIELMCSDKVITASARTIDDYSSSNFPELLAEVELKHELEEADDFYGFGIQYHGGSTTMINRVTIEWK